MDMSVADIIANGKVHRTRIALFDIVLKNDYRRWGAIRKIYETVDPGSYSPYPIDWTLIFTPIESAAWGEIRCWGLPFCPQYPIGTFFADFADPVKKIVIECDGRAYHNAEQDKKRDLSMGALGWSVFRVSGADCKRVLAEPWEAIAELEEDYDNTEASRIVTEWATRSVDGLVWALSVIYYGHGAAEYLRDIAVRVLSARKGI